MPIKKDSSVETVAEWLKSCIGLTDDDLRKSSNFKYFDGEAVFLYNDRAFEELISDLKITIGSARKILLLRETSEIKERYLKSNIAKWTTQDVGEFVRETIKIHDIEIESICHLIIMKRIDGIVFLSYSDPKEMQRDIHDEDDYGIIYKKLFAKRDLLIKDESRSFDIDQNSCEESKVPKSSDQATTTCALNTSTAESLPTYSLSPNNGPNKSEERALVDYRKLELQETDNKSKRSLINDNPETKVHASDQSGPSVRENVDETPLLPSDKCQNNSVGKKTQCKAVEGQTDINPCPTTSASILNKKAINEQGKGVVGEELHKYLKDILHLLPVEMCEGNIINCKLNIIHCNWTKPNELEKKIVFFTITDEDEYNTNEAMKTLWDRIRKNIHCWYEHFQEPDKDLFTIKKQKDDCLVTKTKVISLPQSPLKMRYIMEKSVSDMHKFSNVFLLIDKNLIKSGTVGYCSNLIKAQTDKKKNPYLFGFDTAHKYWLFDPSNYAYGFKLQNITRDKCGFVSHIESHKMEEQHEIVTECLNIDATDISERSPIKETVIHNSELKIQRCRDFRADDAAIQYHEGWVMSTAEHDGAVSFRCFEFKFITNALLKKGCFSVSRFLIIETIRFACGCLNARKNGTILFGIGDAQKNQYFHGEVVGFPITEFKEDFRMHLTDSLRTAIQTCFESHHHRAASKCIGNPVFVEIISELPSVKKFVVEIDIDPSSHFCKEEYFKINRSKLPDIDNIKSMEKEFTLYVRENTGTVKKVKNDQDLFIRTELGGIVLKRTQDEKEKLQSVQENPELPMDKLRRRMCNGSDKFDKSLYPILILNKPTDKQKQSEQWIRSLKFIKHIKFHAVFDFDENSNVNGLCSMVRKEEETIILDEEIFQELSGRKIDLASKLEWPMKTVWIFSNGRADIRPPKLHYNGSNWTNIYSAGIRDAVIFYSQKEIIPKGRALVIVLLLSTDFDGLVETFREIVVRFGWGQILVIAIDDVIKRFVLEFKEMEDNMYDCSIHGKGLTWEHVNSTFLEIAGCEDVGRIHIITSSGVSVPADEKFVETLNDIQILSSRQCENKKFKTKPERMKFSVEKEIQFYKGNKVDWFNFHFQDQVLKRHCFDRLKQTIGNILHGTQGSNRQSKIISTVIISHEPGAGGSTLARHILWEFRALYRCAIVKTITDRTAKNILLLWQHKEANHFKPLLLLVDDLHLSDYSFEDLMHQIYVECRTNHAPEGLICCFLLCQREEQIRDSSPIDSPTVSNTGEVIEPLKQQLTEKEVEWMHEKYEKMESKESDYKLEYLISFMILREGFNKDYIKGTIKRFLTKLDFRSNEFELLEYTALLSTYAPTSKRGPSAFIPIECCDELMGLRTMKSLSWEQSMSDVLKIFLIVEPKETASGMQLRMAHPALAEIVLDQILENKQQSLSSLTLRFLDSSIIQSHTHARGMIVDFTKEMLKRRLKEEYNDNRTTLFSPLVEEICQTEEWHFAVKVLEKGLEKFNDSYIAQALARLCVKYKDFDNAVIWAEKAIEMSVNNKTACSFSHYILATVLEDKFKNDTKHLGAVTPASAFHHILLILDSLDHFLEASRLKIGTGDHVLYPIQGVIKTIITCSKFIRDHVKFSTDVNIREYLTCAEYSPEELNEVWGNLRQRLLTFSSQGERAFEKVEECLCLNTTFYAHDSISSCNKKSREHRLYRNLHYKYPDMFNDFAFFFGATTEECPRSTMPEVINNWHRRRLLQLGGNTYMNICNIILQIRKRANNFSSDNAVCQCIEIKDHLMKITDRKARDFANLVSVNIVLGLLGGRNRDSTDKMIEYCKQIIKMKRGCEDVAHFFICILLWPSNLIDVVYDDDLFYESLKFLYRDKVTKHGRFRGGNYAILKEEKNVTQATTQFFLSKGAGFKSICHRFDIFFREQPESEYDNAIWANQKIKNKLKRSKGHLKFCKGKCHICMINQKSPERFIEIRKIRSGKKEFLSEEEVYFYLGFSIAGPIAYDVKPARHEDIAPPTPDMPLPDKVEEYMNKTEDNLRDLLKQITELKGKRKNGRHLKAKEVSVF